MSPPLLGITMGDPHGVGPELALRAWREREIPRASLVFGDCAVLERCNEQLHLGVPLRAVDGGGRLRADACNVLDCAQFPVSSLRVGTCDAKAGAASAHYVARAVEAARAGDIAAVVTLPVNKEAVRLTIPDFSGHTGYVAQLCGVKGTVMMLACDKLIVTHVSTHVSMAQAVAAVTRERIVQVVRLTASALAKLRTSARIAVAGLNPHAGEGGAFGLEEKQQIAPAVEQCRAEGFMVEGPLPPDTVFLAAVRGRFDAVVCMYHDQGHIPMKLLDFEGGVNITLGLPIVRTSVDHGTAFDIAWKGTASTRSLAAACALALRLLP